MLLSRKLLRDKKVKKKLPYNVSVTQLIAWQKSEEKTSIESNCQGICDKATLVSRKILSLL